MPPCASLVYAPEIASFLAVRLKSQYSDFISLMRFQRYFKDTNVGDVFGGHGTHVCGSAAGAAAGSSVVAPAPDYNGMAPNAKLAFDDISLDGSTLIIPDDLNTRLFPHPHAVGVRSAHSIVTSFSTAPIFKMHFVLQSNHRLGLKYRRECEFL